MTAQFFERLSVLVKMHHSDKLLETNGIDLL